MRLRLDTTPDVPRYKQPEVRLVTLGVEVIHYREERATVRAARP